MTKLLKWLFNPDWFILSFGGGGGSAPASQTQVSDLPEWAKPYAKETLGKAAALTDIDKNKYQPYTQDRIAGFDPLQEQAQAAAGAMQTSPGLGTAQGITGLASLGALGTNYNPYQMGQFTGQMAGQYMNPFLEQAISPQLREAQRASEMQGQTNQAQAVKAGAFGGSRQAIVEAERQRNLGQQMGDIRAQGYANAFDRAQDQFAREQQLREQSRQFGAGLGLQGLQTALQGAGQLGQLGQAEFGQQKDIIGLQSQMGAERQQLDQARKGQQYEDFMREKLYPYQQLEFMSNILRGTPMGTVTSMYTAPPSIGSQIAGLGLAGAGMYGMMNRRAKGGAIKDKENTRAGLSELALMKMGA